ncbi:ABC transporter ATP-binding protein [Microvirga antarctica]|uniref:ABC transporter ATP-binding protein n=1 Tax=Microvirga antarctica TaxID=2819233 RepID=UPI001B306392|nr:oligopeptide/dipeptide ABC transporter ATP-binding protein [Microvirga antarctica]
MSTPLLEVRNVVRDYTLPRPSLFSRPVALRVLHGVSLTLGAGQSLGIVGESGSGKSTLARTVMALDRPQEGEVRIDGENLYALSRTDLRAARRKFQAIFQDPYGSLDPRHSVRRIISEPMRSLEAGQPGTSRSDRIGEVLDAVGLSPAAADKYPHEFSGGQRQRIAIARALVTRPALIVADEPVSALDVSVQAQVLNLMMDLQERFNLAYLFISHDLGVVRVITDRVAVIHLGRIVEEGPTGEVFDGPRHPYTQALVEAVPKPFAGRRQRGRSAKGHASVAASGAAGAGCPYEPQCPLAQPLCSMEAPALRLLAPEHSAACHFA